MIFRQLSQELKESIGKNDTTGAFQILRKAIQGHALEDSVIVRAGQQFGLKQELIKGTISWEDANLTQNQIHNAILQIVNQLAQEEIQQTKIFISYNRETISSKLAYQIRDQMQEDKFQVFIDVEDLAVGEDWAIKLLNEIRTCQYFVLLLSELANSSEMVIREVEEAHRLYKEKRSPVIIPIRVNFSWELKLNHRLHRLLNRIHQLQWENEQDTAPVLGKIMDVLHCRQVLSDVATISEEEVEQFVVLKDAPPTPVAPLEVPRGAVRLESKYYIERPQEKYFIQCVENPGAILRIRGPRQNGKTSLLTRVMAHAVNQDYFIVVIDFQEIDKATLSDLDKLLWEFCYYFAEELDVEEELEKHWSKPRSKKQTCTSFIEKEILRKQDKPILLAIDEADRLFEHQEVSSEFFLLLRSWHEKSKVPNKKEWEKFRLALSYSTEAKLAIQDINASPFNVGEEAKLIPFSEEQVTELAHRHGLQWTAQMLETIMKLLSGQPYLVRRAMYLIAKGEYTFDHFIESATKHDGPYSDHLRHHLINIKQFDECVEAMKDIIDKGKCKDSIIADRLAATGLVKGSPPHMESTCDLYTAYFKGKL